MIYIQIKSVVCATFASTFYPLMREKHVIKCILILPQNLFQIEVKIIIKHRFIRDSGFVFSPSIGEKHSFPIQTSDPPLTLLAASLLRIKPRLLRLSNSS